MVSSSFEQAADWAYFVQLASGLYHSLLHSGWPLNHRLCQGSSVAGPSLRTNVGHMAPFLTACRQCGAQQTVPTRPLATKKSKGALDHISVTTKDGKFPLNQLGQISVKSPQLLVINMAGFPENTAAAVKALRESRMNLNPEVDGTIIRVPVPKVTREHRENLAKLAKQLTNKGKESLRRVRSSAMVDVKKAKSTVSEDVIKLIEKQIQQMADGSMVEMDKQLTTKTKELLGSE
ncbi:ribosome-recycling factor, mitochondrial isoform X4 [Rhinatrema bivittatum]|uniref:ribosome-recycling factor, mitochondrial isoform X4 n=1 Tax=Rhinatrema bivittatum TaxID=194408 RepID=UPI0011268007|nr:ribosome-recycling factor, mitochondrial isoform X4 [Rhinatrema bivittatum]